MNHYLLAKQQAFEEERLLARALSPCICDWCDKLYERVESSSFRRMEFCSQRCESLWMDSHGGCAITSSGRFPRMGFVDGENFNFPANPYKLQEEIRYWPIDILTFLQHPLLTGIRYDLPAEPYNLAVIPVSTFDHWWTKQVDAKTRNMVRKAEKKGVETCETPLTDELLGAIHAIYNETPIRQGRRFPHYGMTPERVKETTETFPTRSIYIATRCEGKIIGFAKMVTEGNDYACLISILSLVSHRDHAPMNALIAGAVKACAERQIGHLAYGCFQYGNKTHDSMLDFKKNNGFQRIDVPRYFILNTIRGELAYFLGLHRRLNDFIPESIASPLRKIRHWLAT